ncbi:cilia- and flagella-associated protein 61 [Drosophila navojoa]|uniref:cilia- and flagella-associated protein 61 n=1 Tax=Drosophila navojoa TaxID=7232 RepID=UPI00084709A1|nr:cilia- and flagella-associated protein 61 [Drosophila navojoa]
MYSVRSATKENAQELTLLIHDSHVKWFGNKRTKYDIKETFKAYQTHRLIALRDNSIVAFAEFRNYPAIGPLPSDSWLDWLLHRYCITASISWLNTLFFTFCIYREDEPESLLALIREVFYRENRLLNLIAVRMPYLAKHTHYIEHFDDLAKYCQIFYPREFSIESNANTQSVFIVNRYGILPTITYRKALAEDNDDIVEMHSRELPEMRAALGDFYIAEELMRTDANAKDSVIIVMEMQNENQESMTAGFMWLNANVDIRYYVRNYEMEMFGNLLSFNPTKPSGFEEITVMWTERTPDAQLFTAAAMHELCESAVLGDIQSNVSDMSVSSLVKDNSIDGNILDIDKKASIDKFYAHEFLYLKFSYIFEKFGTLHYYINKHDKIVNLFYNMDPKNRKKDGVQLSSNVFELRFICVNNDFPLPRLFNCLNAMYSAFPDRDYCIMAIPKTATTLRSHVEALKYFMPVAQRPSDVFDLQEIFITHRSTIFGEISLFPLQNEDIDLIMDMFSDVNKPAHERTYSSASVSYAYNSKINTLADIDNEILVIKQIMADVLSNKNSEYNFFTIRCGNSTRPVQENTAVGYVVLRKYLNRHELLYHFHLPNNDHHLENERAEIISLRLHPLYHNCCDVILRNLAAKTNYYDFYFIYARNRFLFSNDLKSMMMQIEPSPRKKSFFKRQPTKTVGPTFEGLPELDYFNDQLVVFRHKLSPTQWFGNNTRLVILGFSPVARAFLRQLVFQWNSKDHSNSESFTCLPRLQVTVIAAPGLVEAEYDCMFQCTFCKSRKHCFMYCQNYSCYVRDTIKRMDLRLRIHFVGGHIDYINRVRKYVKINQTCDVHYDTLLLMNYKTFSLTIQGLHLSVVPCNFIEINSRLDKFMLFYKLRVLNEDRKRQYTVLVYGSNLSTYEGIEFLMSHGVAPKRIVLVQPKVNTGTEEEQKLNCPYVDQKLQYILDEMLDDLGIVIHRDLTLTHWETNDMKDYIIQAIFTSFKFNKTVTLDCDLFISFKEGFMDYATVHSLKKSKITVKDGLVVVNKNFQTNDPNIYAAGRFIKMVDNINHQYQYTNAMETAKKLMHILCISTNDPNFEYKYSQCTFFTALLPLDYYITKLTMPRRYMASFVHMPCQKCTMTTYNEDNTFCRIGLNHKMIVDEIVIVTKHPIVLDFLEHFCGKHETLLNNLKARYIAGSIKCFLQFLQEPWTELLTHVNFEDYQAANHKILMPMLQNLNRPPSNQLRDFNQHILEQNLLDFVRKHRQDFCNEFALPEDYCAGDTSGASCKHVGPSPDYKF